MRPAAPSVSAIIVNYESATELARGLAALHPLVDDDLDVIVVDQSRDRAHARDVARQYPWVRLVHQANAGFASAVNHGAALARGTYLLILNPDVIVRDDTIARLRRFADAHATVAVVGPRVLNEDGSLQLSARRFPGLSTGIAGRSSWLTRVLPGNPLSRRNLEVSWAAEPTDTDWVSGACMLVRRDAFQAVGGMDEGFFLYWEDADLCRRLKDAAWRTVYLPDAQVVHSGGRSSRVQPVRAAAAFHRSVYRYYVKHGGRGAKLAAPFVGLALVARLFVTILGSVVAGAFRSRQPRQPAEPHTRP